ncbi:MAG: hypothetical protein H0V12_08555, partial [Chloroflexi bacterium]|nr:hypothetical protein [Chloroflexota bacterium]
LYLLDAEGDQAMTALDDRILLHVLNGRRPDTEVRIRYTHRLAHPMVSLFEAGALIGELRPMLLGSRPLRSSDLALPNEVDPAGAPLPEYQPARLTHVADAITAAGGPLEALRTVADELEPLVDEVDLNRAALVAGLDDWIARFVTAAATLGTTGVTRGGVGAVLAWKRERYRALLATVHGLAGRWRERLDAFAAQVAEYDALPLETTDEARFEMLVEIEALVAVEATAPLPPTPGDYRTVLETRAGELATARDGVVAVLGTGTTSLATLLGEIGAAVTDLERFDTQRLELERDEAEIARYGEDLYALAQGMVDEADERIATAADALTEYVAAASALERETSFTTAAHALMGEDFLVVPEFWLRDRQAQELRNAYDGRAALLDHVTGTLGIDFPEDEWLYGVARVRAPMRRWEAATMLAGALSQRELALEPMQLPHRAGDSWMALPFPETLELDTDRLLYTAHFSSPFDTDVRQCGLMLDEWTEIIPATDETTGISFHYDRPNSEPPQVMLLATPPHLNGRWEWADLVDTLHETLQMAKSRAVEPDHLAGTSYARFVPATISAATRSPITIGLNYAVANDVYQFIPIRSFDA